MDLSPYKNYNNGIQYAGQPPLVPIVLPNEEDLLPIAGNSKLRPPLKKEKLIMKIESEIEPETKQSGILGLLFLFLLFIKICWKYYKKRYCICITSIVSIGLSLLITVISLSLLDNLPYLFYYRSVSNEGFIDSKFILPDNKLFNTSQISGLLAGNNDLRPIPRIYAEVLILGSTNLTSDTTTTGVFLDVPAENEVDMGINDGINNIEENEIYISSNLAQSLDLNKGDLVKIFIALDKNIKRKVVEHFKDQVDETFSGVQVLRKVRINTFSSESLVGRFSKPFIQDHPSILLLNIKNSVKYSLSDRSQINFNVDLSDYSNTLYIQLFNRIDYYTQSNQKQVLKRVISKISGAYVLLNCTALRIELPIASGIEEFKLASALTSIVFRLIVVGTILLTIIIIDSNFSMMLGNIESDIAIKRSIGMTIYKLIVQMSLFSIIISFAGIILGVLLLIITMYLMNDKIFPKVGLDFKIKAPLKETLVISVIAVLAPLVCMSLYVRRFFVPHIITLLSKTHSKTQSVIVDIKKHSKGFPISLFMKATLTAILSTFLGIFLPKSTLSEDTESIVYTFLLLLINLLVGLELLMINFTYIFESVFSRVFTLFQNKSLSSLIRMNLVSHRLSNRKTILIVSICMSLITFFSIFFELQAASEINKLRSEIGSRYGIRGNISPWGWLQLQKRVESLGSVKWAGRSLNMKDPSNNLMISSIETLNYGGLIQSDAIELSAITPNYEEFILDKSLIQTSQLSESAERSTKGGKGSRLSLVEFMYTRFNQNGVYISETLRKAFGLDCRSPNRNKFIIKKGMTSVERPAFYEMGCSGSLANYPGFLMGGLEDSSQNIKGDMIIPISSYIQMVDEEVPVVWERIMRYSAVYVEPVIEENFDKMKKVIEIHTPRLGLQVVSDERLTGPIFARVRLARVVMYIMGVILGGLSIYNMISAVTFNLMNQKIDVGTMRAFGLNSVCMYKMFIYESFVVVSVGVLIGATVGCGVGASVVLQLAAIGSGLIVFTVPIPYFHILTFYFLSMLLSLIFTFSITRSYMKKSIVMLLKDV